MPEAGIVSKHGLCMLQRLSLGRARLGQGAVEFIDHQRRSLVTHKPQAGQCRARTGLDRHTGQTKRSLVVAGRRLAGTQGQQLNRGSTVTAWPDKIFKIVQRQIIVIGQHECAGGVPAELPVRGDVYVSVIVSEENVFEVTLDGLMDFCPSFLFLITFNSHQVEHFYLSVQPKAYSECGERKYVIFPLAAQ